MNLVLKSTLIALTLGIIFTISSHAQLDYGPLKDIRGVLAKAAKNVDKRYDLSSAMIGIMLLCYVQQMDRIYEYLPLNISTYSQPIKNDINNAFESLNDNLYYEVKRANRGTILIKDVDFAVKYVQESCERLGDKGEVALMEWKFAMKRNGIPWVWHSLDDMRPISTKTTASPFTSQALFGIELTADGTFIFLSDKTCGINDKPSQEEQEMFETLDRDIQERIKSKNLAAANTKQKLTKDVNATANVEHLGKEEVAPSETKL